MHRVAASAALALALAFAGNALAQGGAVVTSSAPGKVGVAETIKATATITAIDKATRDITLKGPQGNEMTLTAGPDVRNFDKLKVGDQVALQYVEALTVELKKGGGLVVQRKEEAAAVGAKPGAQPAGAMGRQVTAVADVIAVDAARQMITLRGPQRTAEVRVRDPEQFKLIAKGDQVEVTYTQAVALAVEPVAKK